MEFRQKTIIIIQPLFLLFFCLPTVQAQKIVDQIFTKSTTQIISLNDENLSTKSTQFNQPIDLGEYGVYDLSLEQTYLFSDNYLAKKADKNNGDIKLPLTFKGTIQGQPNTLVSLTTNKDFLSGFIDNGEEVIFFEPYKNFNSNAVKNELIIYYQKDVIDQGHACTANHTDQQTEQITPPNNQFKSVTAGCYEVEMVLVADYGMYQKHGSNTLNHIASVLNNVQANYDNEFNDPITFLVVGDYIATSSGMDLWSSTAYAPDLLNEFRNSDFTNVAYDLASLWVTRDIWDYVGGNVSYTVAGIAYRPSVCTSRSNLIEDHSSNIASLQRTLAHEIGHNFSATHDAAGSPTIMAPSGGSTNTWSTQSQNQINAFYPTATCLCASGDAADLTFVSCGNASLSDNTLNISDVQVKNVGTIPADGVKVGWYLSSDNNITTSDYLAATLNTPTLSAGYSTNLDLTTNTGSIPPGNYYLGSIIDYENSLAEFDEDNNIGCVSSEASFTVNPPQPDLEILTCGFLASNRTFYGVQVQNLGIIPSGATTLGVYLSPNNTVNTNDYKVATTNVPALNGEATSDQLDISFNTGTSSVPPGDYYVGLIVDTDNSVTESNENNNTSCVSSSASITISSEKITVIAPNGSDTYRPGDVINIEWTYNTSENVTIRMEASTGTTYQISSSAENNGSFDYTISSNVTLGQYRIFVQSKGDQFVNDYGDYFTIEACSLGGVGNGDVNVDGELNILDAYIVAQYSVGLREDGDCENLLPAEELCLERADINCDGYVNILDAFNISRCAVGLGDEYCPD